jgi:hypothetical protein
LPDDAEIILEIDLTKEKPLAFDFKNISIEDRNRIVEIIKDILSQKKDS